MQDCSNVFALDLAEDDLPGFAMPEERGEDEQHNLCLLPVDAESRSDTFSTEKTGANHHDLTVAFRCDDELLNKCLKQHQETDPEKIQTKSPVLSSIIKLIKPQLPLNSDVFRSCILLTIFAEIPIGLLSELEQRLRLSSEVRIEGRLPKEELSHVVVEETFSFDNCQANPVLFQYIRDWKKVYLTGFINTILPLVSRSDFQNKNIHITISNFFTAIEEGADWLGQFFGFFQALHMLQDEPEIQKGLQIQNIGLFIYDINIMKMLQKARHCEGYNQILQHHKVDHNNILNTIEALSSSGNTNNSVELTNRNLHLCFVDPVFVQNVQENTFSLQLHQTMTEKNSSRVVTSQLMLVPGPAVEGFSFSLRSEYFQRLQRQMVRGLNSALSPYEVHDLVRELDEICKRLQYQRTSLQNIIIVAEEAIQNPEVIRRFTPPQIQEEPQSLPVPSISICIAPLEQQLPNPLITLFTAKLLFIAAQIVAIPIIGILCTNLYFTAIPLALASFTALSLSYSHDEPGISR